MKILIKNIEIFIKSMFIRNFHESIKKTNWQLNLYYLCLSKLWKIK